MIPDAFEKRMRGLLGEEYGPFRISLEQERFQALRLNPAKVDVKQWIEQSGWALAPVPWCPEGFYYDGESLHPGKHPYHSAGLYYIQEPSAMLPAECLDAQPGERILDLCAAPGGKSTQIAAAMGGRGLLIANEIHPARARVLSENIERMGIPNALVTNETPERLADRFPFYFDRIMVDAPCSGEGMFRKSEAAAEEWSEENVSLCAARQDRILSCAAQMLAPGGRIVYSTCTFAPEENEGSVSRFLSAHPEFSLIPIPKQEGMEPARAEWITQPARDLRRAVRLFPHKVRGEGHFAAALQKEGVRTGNPVFSVLTENVPGGILAEREAPEYLDFCRQTLSATCNKINGNFVRFADQLYLLPEGAPDLKGLKILRPGLHLGTLKKGRFEPSHALALYLTGADVLRRAELSAQDARAGAYLRGETFSWEGDKGWYLICVDGYSLGWGKLAGGVLKNHYPKGLRHM